VRYKRTEKAAKADKASKWEIVEAIALDAVDAGYDFSGIESCLAARAAFEKNGYEHTDAVVKNLCVLAGFDHRSTAKQRAVWRRYGWSVVALVASAGWTAEKAYDLLAYEHQTQAAVRDAVVAARNVNIPRTDLADEWTKWLTKLNALLIAGAKLAHETDRRPHAITGAPYAEFAHQIYQRITERKLDAEIRDLLDSEEVDR